MSFDAGAITGQIQLDNSPMKQSLGQARGMADRFRGGMASMGKKIAKSLFNPFTAALAGVASAAGLAAMLKSTASEMDRIAKVGSRLNITTEALTGLGFAAEQSGVETRTLEMGLQRMTRRVAEAAQGSGEAQGALAELGLNARQLAAMSPDQQFLKIADAMQGVSSQSDKVRLGFKLFDSEGVSLIQTMNGGADAIRATMNEAKEMNATFNATDAAKVQAMNDALNKVKTVIQGALQKAVVALAPFVTAIADRFTDAAKEGEGFGKLVSGYIEGVAVRVARAADVLQLFKAGWDVLRAGAAAAIGGVIKGIAKMARAMFKLVDNPVGRKLFGTGNVEVGRELIADFERIGDVMLHVADQAAGDAKEAWDRALSGESSTKVKQFFADIRANAQAAAEESSKTTPPVNDVVDAVNQANPKQLEKVNDAMAGLRKEVEQFGMTDAQKRLADFSAMEGATPEKVSTFKKQLEELQQLQDRADTKSKVQSALEGIKTPFAKFQEGLERFREWFKDGLINQAEVDKLRAKLRRDTLGEQQSAKLIRAGSAESQRLRFQQGRGRGDRRDFDRQQVEQQKTTNQKLDEIARHVQRQASGGSIELVGA